MAIEPAAAEINLRQPRRGRDLSALLWLCGWGIATAIALSALAITSQTQTATERLRSIFAVKEPMARRANPAARRPTRTGNPNADRAGPRPECGSRPAR